MQGRTPGALNWGRSASASKPRSASSQPSRTRGRSGAQATFETLLKRFALLERPLARIAEMIHDADLRDDKFHAPGAEGIDRLLEGLARLGWSDEKILQHGLVCFEALYAQVKAS